jgi:serine/threonine protein kinase
MSLLSGTRLGPYEISSQIGQGGMGEVYRATDTRLKRQVAIKVLPASISTDPERLARFQREAEVLASLNHPHIAVIYGLEESDGTMALVMELVEGDDLSQRVAHGALSLDEALPIATQIAEALESAHAKGVIHRDLKPANIKLRADGTVKVLDFGLAKALSSGPAAGAESPTITSPAMTERGVILGTAAYMSPEQAQGRSVDQRSDIFSFGAVLYELLGGKRPFRGDSVLDVLSAVLRDDPRPLPVPAPVAALVQRCLSKRGRPLRIGHGTARGAAGACDGRRSDGTDAAHHRRPSVCEPGWRHVQ